MLYGVTFPRCRTDWKDKPPIPPERLTVACTPTLICYVTVSYQNRLNPPVATACLPFPKVQYSSGMWCVERIAWCCVVRPLARLFCWNFLSEWTPSRSFPERDRKAFLITLLLPGLSGYYYCSWVLPLRWATLSTKPPVSRLRKDMKSEGFSSALSSRW